MRFHIVGLPILPVSEKYNAEAFTQKILKLCKMLMSLKHEVILYGVEGSEAQCSEFVQIISLKEVIKTWGNGDNRFELGYDCQKEYYHNDFNSQVTPLTLEFNRKVIIEINKRKKPDDFLLLAMGHYQKPIADEVGLYLTCESGIGYRGSFKFYGNKNEFRNHRTFESQYLQNFTYGNEERDPNIDGNFYDRVIPNYFDPKDFEYSEEKDDYYLFIGRLIKRKGLGVASDVAKIMGKKLKVVGQGVKSWNGKKLVGIDTEIEGDHIEFVGYADFEKRKKLLAKAKLTLIPTLYLEPFGGVNVESQLSGTPVLTTNFGAFPETVVNGKTGFLCNTMNDFIEGARQIEAGKLDPKEIRKHAERYLIDNVKFEYQKWFTDLYQVYLSTTDKKYKGWYFVKEK
jgi:glycosyltransferase involved in cell wall biosynthesis